VNGFGLGWAQPRTTVVGSLPPTAAPLARRDVSQALLGVLMVGAVATVVGCGAASSTVPETQAEVRRNATHVSGETGSTDGETASGALPDCATANGAAPICATPSRAVGSVSSTERNVANGTAHTKPEASSVPATPTDGPRVSHSSAGLLSAQSAGHELLRLLALGDGPLLRED